MLFGLCLSYEPRDQLVRSVYDVGVLETLAVVLRMRFFCQTIQEKSDSKKSPDALSSTRPNLLEQISLCSLFPLTVD